jgi:hypothetical protein
VSIDADVPSSRQRTALLLDEANVVRDVRRDPLQQDFQGQRPVTGMTAASPPSHEDIHANQRRDPARPLSRCRSGRRKSAPGYATD